MTNRKECVAVYITTEQAIRLRALREETNVPTSVLIRDGIDLILDKREAALRILRRMRKQKQEAPRVTIADDEDEDEREPPRSYTSNGRPSARR